MYCHRGVPDLQAGHVGNRHPGTRDGRELQRWNPRLHYLDHTSAMADYAKIPLTAQRTLYRVLYAVPAIRDYDRLYRFSF